MPQIGSMPVPPALDAEGEPQHTLLCRLPSLRRRDELANWLPEEVTFKPKVNVSPQVCAHAPSRTRARRALCVRKLCRCDMRE